MEVKMKKIRLFLVIPLFIFSMPLLASGPYEKNESAARIKAKKEFMQTWLKRYGTKAPVGVPDMSPFADWDYYYLNKPISWRPEAEYQSEYKTIEVPPGFVTDLTSIPRIFWSILPKTGRYAHAAIIHDYLYWTQTLPRDVADKVLKIDMEESNVDSSTVSAIYNAVRTFGESAWNENAELKAKGEKRFLKKFPEDPRISWEEWKKQKDVFKE
jgi:hypothetical protein